MSEMITDSKSFETPYEGQTFKSFEVLKECLEEYSRQNYVKFWIRSSHTISSLKSKLAKRINPELKYACMKFACIFGGEKIRCRGSGIRKSTTYRNLGCPCMINATVTESGDHVKLDTVVLEHNHANTKSLYESLKKTKKKNLLNHSVQLLCSNQSAVQDENIDSTSNNINTNKKSVSDVDTLNLNLFPKSNKKTKTNIENDNKSNVNNYLENIKEKYGSRVKIIVINSENQNIDSTEENEDLTVNSDVADDDLQLVETADKASVEKEICRLCLSADEKLTPIFNPALPLESTILSFKIMGCASIELDCNDGLPSNICKSCEETLDIAYNFRVKCEKSDSILRKAHMSMSLKNDSFETLENFNLDDDSQSIPDELEKPKTCEDDVAVTTEAIHQADETEVAYFPVCPVCDQKFSSYTIMLNHVKEHSDCNDEDAFMLPCNLCNVVCATVDDFSEHMFSHLNKNNIQTVFECSQCDSCFIDIDELKSHEKVHESKSVVTDDKSVKVNNNFLCNVCGKILKSKDRFQSHKNSHEGLKPHICFKCGKGFADRKNMHQHYDIVHLHKANHECPICHKKFYTPTKMKSHLTMHYGVKPFFCDVCGKSFRLKMNMTKHKKTHSNNRPHKCDKCNASFIDKNMLTRHSYVHGGTRPYPCPICGHRFSVKFHLKKHLQKGKCSSGNSEYLTEEWTETVQDGSKLSSSECVVIYETKEEDYLNEHENEPMNIDILCEYEVEENS